MRSAFRIHTRWRLAIALTVLWTPVGLAAAAANQWVPIGPPTAPIFALAIDPLAPTTIYVGTAYYGVFKTANAGANWAASNSGLTTLDVRALAVSPQITTTLYAGTAEGGVFRSTDGAATWTAVNNGLTWRNVLALAVDPTNPLVVYAGTFPGGVFKTSDGGNSWQPVNTGITLSKENADFSGFIDVGALAIDARTGAVYAGTDNGVFVSHDGAATWTRLGGKTYQFELISGLAFDPHSTATIYATSYYNGPTIVGNDYGLFLKSTDGGGTWQAINNCLPYRVLYGILADPSSPRTLYVATGSLGVYKTGDGGASWTAVNDGLTNPEVHALGLVPGSPATLYAATFGGGVFKTTIDAGGPAAQTNLCLNSGRFRVGVTWQARNIGTSGTGQAIPMTSDTGSFWFFTSNNLELVVKVVDGRAFNNKFWVFYGALSNVEYTITVTDTATGAVKTYFNPQGQLASVADTAAF